MTSTLPPAHEVAERGLAHAPADGRIVLVEDISEAELRFANNTVTTNGVRRDRNVTVVSLDARRDGTAAGVVSGSGALDVTLLCDAAQAASRSAPLAEDAAELVSGVASPDFTESSPETSLSVLTPVLKELSQVFARSESARRISAGFATHRVTTTYVASSTGLRRRHVLPNGRLELIGRSSDGTRSSWAGAGTNDFSDVDVHDLEERVATRLTWAERQVDLDAGHYETVLPGDAVADLVLMIDAYASGRHAEEGSTVFSAAGGKTRIGERLFSLPFRLRSEPSDPLVPVAPFVATSASTADASVFDNGAEVGPIDLIEDGVLRRLHYHRAGAERSGAEFTPEIGNLRLELPGADASVEHLVSQLERGLLLTCLWYIRPVDPATLLLTGLTRDGVYLVERGEVVAAVNNFRFNVSPVDMLSRTEAAGRSSRALSREWGEWMSRSVMPPLRVGDFNMSSVSQAI